jgi:truncated hemoglobin YjbI
VLFYQKLFELDPSLRPMFPGDMSEQRKKLMQMITAGVKALVDQRRGLKGLVRLALAREAGPREFAQFVIDFRQHLAGRARTSVPVRV